MPTIYLQNIGQLANILQHNMRSQYPQAMDALLKQIGEEVKDRATTTIGRLTPLSAVGPFPAWSSLAASTIAQKQKKGLGRGGNPRSILYATGAFHDDVSYTVGHKQVSIGTTKDYIVYTELGTGRMPPRPVFGPAALTVMRKAMPKMTNIIGSAIADFQVFSRPSSLSGGGGMP